MLVVNSLCNYCNTMVKPILLQRSLKMIKLTKTTAFNSLIQIVSLTSRHVEFFRNKLRIASLGLGFIGRETLSPNDRDITSVLVKGPKTTCKSVVKDKSIWACIRLHQFRKSYSDRFILLIK